MARKITAFNNTPAPPGFNEGIEKSFLGPFRPTEFPGFLLQAERFLNAAGAPIAGRARPMFIVKYATCTDGVWVEGNVVVPDLEQAQRLFAHLYCLHRNVLAGRSVALSPDDMMFLRAFQEWDDVKRMNWILQCAAEPQVHPRFGLEALPMLPVFPKM